MLSIRPCYLIVALLAALASSAAAQPAPSPEAAERQALDQRAKAEAAARAARDEQAKAEAVARADKRSKLEAEMADRAAMRAQLQAELEALRKMAAQIQDPKQKDEVAAKLAQLAKALAELDAVDRKIAAEGAALDLPAVRPAGRTDPRPVDVLAPTAPAARVSAGDQAVLVDAGNRFAFDLHGRLRSEPGNLFYSPASISTALAMTFGGARGETARQMAAVLKFPADRLSAPEWIHAANAGLVKERRGGPERGCELSVANALWGRKGYAFAPEFLKLLKENYAAGLEQLDFAADPDGSRKTINRWAEKETREKIKDLLPPGSIMAATRLVLTNAVYFKGQWAAAFDKADTQDADFRLTPGQKIAVPTMNKTARFRYAELPDCQVLELPYKTGSVAMLIVLPKQVDGLAEVEKSLGADKLGQWLPNLRQQEVRVALPRVRMTATFRLGDALKAMGMPLAFDPAKADFSGMNGGKEPLWIGEVIHKAFVDVNEEGTEAAAATAVVMPGAALRDPAPPVVFRADHPFLFFIRDTRTGCILFAGRVADPRG